ncbi:MAG: SprB repeat-containing protein [Bacteroidota bacterium]|nr:MAG: SprB repeat-containing protein [Bacteroidota bacterium]
MKHLFLVLPFISITIMSANAAQLNNLAESGSMDSAACDIVIEGLVSNVNCKAGKDGKIDLNVSGTGLETITWSHGETTEDVYQLEAGSYSVLVKSSACRQSAVFVVSEPENHLQISEIQIQPPTCADRDDASIDLQIKGGTEPYLVYLDTLVSNGAFYSLKPGNYALKINDSKLCRIDIHVEIPEVQVLQIQLGEDIVLQSGETVEIDAGAGYANYYWSSGERSQILFFAKETDKIYTEQLSVEVTDYNDCTHHSNVKKITVYPAQIIESDSNQRDKETTIEPTIYSEPETYSATTTNSDTTNSTTEPYSE